MVLSDKWFDMCFNFKDSFAVVIDDMRYNFIDICGNTLCDKWHNECMNFECGFAIVRDNGRYNFIVFNIKKIIRHKTSTMKLLGVLDTSLKSPPFPVIDKMLLKSIVFY